ncbi:MAG: immunoglobulin domain-containing protein, partial [Rhodoferax sp.]|nr:immunoglobulin domain-containing protein [Rhodoferax sp.]
MTKLKLFATSVVCAIGMALTACGGGLSVAVPGGVQTPSITSQPVNQSVIAGQSATFSVAATGSETLSFQWKKGGADIPGATSSSYTTPATSNADSGAVFTVVVSNSAGTAISSHATLTV